MAKNPTYWIEGAIKHPGRFTKQAKRAGKSVTSFARQVVQNPGRFDATTVRRARLARTLKSF